MNFHLEHGGRVLEEVVSGHDRRVEEDVVLDDVTGGEEDGDGDAGGGDQPHESVDADPQQYVVALQEQEPIRELLGCLLMI